MSPCVECACTHVVGDSIVQFCVQVKCNSCEGVSLIAIHIPLHPWLLFHGHVCSSLAVHVCILGIVHKEQCYNDSENLCFTLIGYQFMNCLLPTPDSHSSYSVVL